MKKLTRKDTFSDRNSKHVAQALRKIGISEKKIRFVTALDLIKCLKQIK